MISRSTSTKTCDRVGNEVTGISGEAIFITGGRGFIGSHLLRRFLQRGNRVTVFDNGHRNALGYTNLEQPPGLTMIEGDIRDRHALTAVMERQRYVLHLAAIAGVSSYFKAPLRTMEVNYGGTENVLSCARAMAGLRLLLGFSSSEIYGPDARDVREDGLTSQGDITDRRWVYSISKLAAEKLAYAYFWEFNVPVCFVRPFNIYGPGQIGEGAVSAFVYRAVRGMPLKVTGDGGQVRAFCHVEDFCDAIESCLVQADAVRGNSFNIGDPCEPITMLELAERIVKLTGGRSRIELVPHQGQDVRYRCPSIEKASRLLGYKPRRTLEEGLRETIEWFRAVNPSEPI